MSKKSVTPLSVDRVQFSIGEELLWGYYAPELEGTDKDVNYLSGRQLAESIGLNHSTVVQKRMPKELKAMLGNISFTDGIYKTSSGGDIKVRLWRLEDAYSYCLYHYSKNSNPRAYSLMIGINKLLGRDNSGLEALNLVGKKGKAKGKEREKQIQLAYQAKYGGQIEFANEYGRIDLVTNAAVFEFKYYKKYKECLGQLLAYSGEHPNKALVAVLFGLPVGDMRENSTCLKAKKLLNSFGIKVRFVQ